MHTSTSSSKLSSTIAPYKMVIICVKGEGGREKMQGGVEGGWVRGGEKGRWRAGIGPLHICNAVTVS